MQQCSWNHSFMMMNRSHFLLLLLRQPFHPHSNFHSAPTPQHFHQFIINNTMHQQKFKYVHVCVYYNNLTTHLLSCLVNTWIWSYHSPCLAQVPQSTLYKIATSNNQQHHTYHYNSTTTTTYNNIKDLDNPKAAGTPPPKKKKNKTTHPQYQTHQPLPTCFCTSFAGLKTENISSMIQ